MFSTFDLIWQSMRLVSLLLGGLLADVAGIRAVYYTGSTVGADKSSGQGEPSATSAASTAGGSNGSVGWSPDAIVVEG